MNVKYNAVTKSVLVMIPLISANPATSQEDAGLQDRFVTVNGTQIHYRTGGEGPFLLMLHGFTLSGEQWGPFIQDFATDYTVIIPDLPRHGRSKPHKTSYAAWADLMLDFLKALKINRVMGIGHSAGAITLLTMARQGPACLESLILVAGAHRTSPGGRKLLMEDGFEKAGDVFEAYYLSIHPGGRQQIDAIFKDLNEMAWIYNAEAGQPILFSEMLAGIHVPALLIWGDRDPYFPVDIAAELYQKLSDAELWVIPGQGHVPLWPDWGGDADAAAQFVSVAGQFFAATISRNKNTPHQVRP